MKLVRYNPFNDLNYFGNAFNDFFNDTPFKSIEREAFVPAVDILNETDKVVLNVALPGMKKEDISVNIEDRVLTVKGERKSENEEKKDNFYRREISYGTFKRSFALSDDVMTDDVAADYKDGILKVTLKKDEAKTGTRQITIN